MSEYKVIAGNIWQDGQVVKPEFGNHNHIKALKEALEKGEDTSLKSLNQKMQDLMKDETAFLEELEFEKNEHGVYLYISANGHSRISLDGILHEYKTWLLDNKKITLKGQ